MIDTEEYLSMLDWHGLRYFVGVPDALLKNLLACIEHVPSAPRFCIAANEGSAVAIAAGHYLATQELPVVYMQNSGLGNAVNPLTSLADAEVYSIPMLLIVGWRGEPGVPDEPQHAKQSRITKPLLDVLGIPNAYHPKTIGEAEQAVAHAVDVMRRTQAPVALIVREKSFASSGEHRLAEDDYELRREEVIAAVVDASSATTIVVATTGGTSRELFEHRSRAEHERDFLCVGSMGHASQIALAIACAKPGREVICLDGDGAAIMHMGGLTCIGARAPSNLHHVILNNGSYESTGGQLSAGFQTDFVEVALGCRYRAAHRVTRRAELESAIQQLLITQGPNLLEVRIGCGQRANLGRPNIPLAESKAAFMRFVEG